MDPRSRFAGRSVIVTGAAQGIGLAIAERFAREEARVLLVDVDSAGVSRSAAAIRATGGQARSLKADVTKPADARRIAATAVKEHGGIDVLVNNAGVLRSTKVVDISSDEWDLVLNVNLKGAFLCAQACHAALAKTGHGRIVNMASLAGRATSTLGGAHYTTAKAGVLGLSRHLAREWARDGISVNAISPGMVDTPMVRGNTDPARLSQVLNTIPFGRLADPEEIAALACFLASDEAAYITGANVDIHGGELIMA